MEYDGSGWFQPAGLGIALLGFLITRLFVAETLQTDTTGLFLVVGTLPLLLGLSMSVYETSHTVANVVHEEGREIDLSAMPHAIFTEPQIAGVGATEEELDTEYVVGRAEYADSPMGRAKKLDDGFVKVLASPDGEILGAHAIGYEAAALLHEVVVAMRTGATAEDVADTIHAHPTLSKIVEAAFRDVPV